MLGTTSSLDKLPVVELRPFVSRQWLPSKSRPDLPDRSLTSLSAFSNASSSFLTSSTSKSTSPKRTYDHSWETKRSLPQRSVSLPPNKLSARQNYHHQESPRLRAEEINYREFPSPIHPAAESQDFTMEVQGQRIKDERKGNLSLFHSHHWEYYKSTRSEPTKSIGLTPGILSPDMENIRTRIEHLENSYVDDSIYDSFDRAKTLPSISVRMAPMRRRRARNERKPSAKVPSQAPYRLGVANSLDVLSHFGQPGRIERQLTMQLKNTIHQLRRTKDNMPGARVLYRVDNCSTPGDSLVQMNDSTQNHSTISTPRKQTDMAEATQARTISESDNADREAREGSAMSRKLPVMIPPAPNDDPMPSPAVPETSREQQDHSDAENVIENDKNQNADEPDQNADEVKQITDENQKLEAKENTEEVLEAPDNAANDNAQDASGYESSHSGVD